MLNVFANRHHTTTTLFPISPSQPASLPPKTAPQTHNTENGREKMGKKKEGWLRVPQRERWVASCFGPPLAVWQGLRRDTASQAFAPRFIGVSPIFGMTR